VSADYHSPAFAEPTARPAGPVLLEPTPAVGENDLEATPQETIGPAFAPNSPIRSNFRESGVAGEPVTLRFRSRSEGQADKGRTA
jgi:hypothetical protein